MINSNIQKLLPEKFLCKYLFLLVGTNPLPNLVAGVLLTKEEGTVYLLHSDATAFIVENFKKVLEQIRPDLTVEPRKIDESDKVQIESKVKDLLSKISEGKEVGLNYTGGTKAMATHVYRTIAANRKNGAKFTYLDAGKLQMCLDGEEGTVIPGSKEPVVDMVRITLEQLFSLHGLELENEKIKRELPSASVGYAVKEIAAAVSTHAPAWRSWCNRNLRTYNKLPPDWEQMAARMLHQCGSKIGEDNQQEWQKAVREFMGWLSAEVSKTNVPKDFPLPEGDLIAIARALTGGDKELSFGKASGYLKLDKKEDEKKLVKWLDGEWLDNYVFQCIQNISKQPGSRVTDVGMDIKTKSPRNFQFDVAALCGYQLFAFSCTTDISVGLNKSKLFEAYRRARDLGGDEARVAVVGCYDKPQNIQKTFEDDWQAKRQMIRVFGRKDLPNLEVVLADWFKTTAGIRTEN